MRMRNEMKIGKWKVVIKIEKFVLLCDTIASFF